MNIIAYDTILVPPEHLKYEVAHRLHCGWQPYGPPVLIPDSGNATMVLQAMVQYEQKPDAFDAEVERVMKMARTTVV